MITRKQPVKHLLAVTLLLAASASFAQTQTEVQKLVASDSAAGQMFGNGIAISGDTAVIGAWEDDENGNMAGAAFVFVHQNGTWGEVQKLTASDGEAFDLFGYSVAIDGDTIVVGATDSDPVSLDNIVGAAYVFTRANNGIWSEQQRLTPIVSGPNEADLSFGASVSISGNVLVVGDHQGYRNGIQMGAVHVFTQSSGTWSQSTKLTPSDGQPGDQFGIAASIDGTTLLIGADGEDEMGNGAGAAYVFEFSGGWSEQQKLLGDGGGVGGDHFGRAVSLDGNTAVVGSPNDDDVANSSGKVHVFTRTSGSWSQQDALTTTNVSQSNQLLGTSVSVRGDILIAGAPGEDAAFVFSRVAGEWSESKKLVPSAGALNPDSPGSSVALSADAALALVGNPPDPGNGSFSGSVYAYELADGFVPLTSWATAQGGASTTGNLIDYGGAPVGWTNSVTSQPLATLDLTDDFEIQWTLDSNPSAAVWVVGLGTSETGPDWRDIEFGLRCSTGNLNVRENGAWVTGNQPALTQGETISIRVDHGTIEYRRNGKTIHTSTYSGTPGFYVDTAFKQGAASLRVFRSGGEIPEPPGQDTPVTNWTGASGGVTTNANQVSFSGAPTGWFRNTVRSGGLSTLGYSDDYEVRWKIDSSPVGTTWIVGLGITETNADWRDVEFGLRSSDGVLNVRENGTWRVGTQGQLMSIGDVISIYVNNGALEYRLNDQTIYTSTYPGAPDFYIDTSFRSGAIALSASVRGAGSGSAGQVPITSWQGATGGVSSSGNDLSYSGTPTGWRNTIRSVPLATLGAAGDYTVSWTIGSTAANTTWIVGLGAAETNVEDWRDVDYGLRSSQGVLNVRENGTWLRGGGQSLTPGDVLSIHVSGTLVEFQLNGTTIQSATASGTENFYVDTAFKNGAIALDDFTLTPQ